MDEKIKGTLVILTYNEIEGLKALFNKIPINQIDEVFAIDPGSTDGTLNFLKKNGIKVIIQKIKGRGEAFRIGIKSAKHENIVFFSPDGNEDPNDIIKIFRFLKENYDMVIASRFMKDSRADDENEFLAIRSFGNKTFTKIANLLWGGKLHDSINGFRGIKKNKFAIMQADAHGFGIEYQMSIRAKKMKLKIKEFPTFEGDRIGGQSTAHTFKTGLLFIKLILSELWKGKSFK
ncbi:MAG: glycosyltransferase family 2 protein [Nanoarchaeota archaeon]|nr:glycosyltransferase family 2 protein [Nanoarchaeota archaeon]